jgi:hypothetical protein
MYLDSILRMAEIRTRVHRHISCPSPHSVILCDSVSSPPHTLHSSVFDKRIFLSLALVGMRSCIIWYHWTFSVSDPGVLCTFCQTSFQFVSGNFPPSFLILLPYRLAIASSFYILFSYTLFLFRRLVASLCRHCLVHILVYRARHQVFFAGRADCSDLSEVTTCLTILSLSIPSLFSAWQVGSVVERGSSPQCPSVPILPPSSDAVWWHRQDGISHSAIETMSLRS